MRNEVQLIAYADRLGGDIPALIELLRGPLSGTFGGVHLLPFFTPIDGADAGFDPTDHTEVDAHIGTWDDVAALGQEVELMADLIVNHIAASSSRFQDFLERGEASPHAGMFLTLSSVFPDGAMEADLARIYRPRPGLPLTRMTLVDGSRRILWTTFTDRQIDLDVRDRRARAYLRDVLERLVENGVSIVRLDAVGYAIKTPGTSCFMTPETFDFIDELAGWARGLGIEVLVEVHSHYQTQIEIAERVDWVYDFALPPLVLHSLFTGTTDKLVAWLEMRPHNAVTVLDTHDGIGVLDVAADREDRSRAGLLSADEIDRVVERIHTNSDGQSRKATGTAASNVDLYQVNCTFYDALARDDDRYLIARLIQMFTPGVPQVYYVGLLAGTNDMELLERTGVGRDINRHYYTSAEIEDAMGRPVVERLLSLIRFRGAHPAFDGAWDLLHIGDGSLAMSWEESGERLELTVDVRAATFSLVIKDQDGARTVTDLLDLGV